jgi:hypothetical protein
VRRVRNHDGAGAARRSGDRREVAKAERDVVFRRRLRHPHEVDRQLARNGKGGDAKTDVIEPDFLAQRKRRPIDLIGRARQGPEHGIALDEARAHALRGEHPEGLRLS